MTDFGLPPDERTAQDELLDAILRHQVGLLRVVGSIRNEVVSLLDETEADLRRTIERRLRAFGPGGPRTSANLRRLARLFDDIRRIRTGAWESVTTVWLDRVAAVALAEPAFLDGIIKTVIPTTIETQLPTARQLRAIVNSRPFEGRTLRQWARSVRQEDIERIHRQIQIGLTQNEAPREIARRVVGRAQLNGRDGVTNITRRNAEAITRTAVNHVANQARQEYAVENKDIVDDELYVATLDGRTTRICASLDGERFPIGEGPIPPIHFNCRSVRVLILDEEAIGSRPAKPATRQQMLREFARRRRFRTVPRNRDALPRGTKREFDLFERQRMRELTGRVPAKTTFEQWLRRQPREFQDDWLGPTRARLFRDGNVGLDRFVLPNGREIPLSQLATREAGAFEAAGFDVDAFTAATR